MSDTKPEKFGILLTRLMRERGFQSDEQLARRAMMQQRSSQGRINVQRRTINNWRNQKTTPRSISDPQLGLVMGALNLDEAQRIEIERALSEAPAPPEKATTLDSEQTADSAVRSLGQWVRTIKIPREAYFAVAALSLLQTAILAVVNWEPAETASVSLFSEIPPTQLSVSQTLAIFDYR